MSRTSVDAGQLNETVQIITLREEPGGVWTWRTVRRAYASIELSTARSLFSEVGIGARAAELVLRRQDLTLHDALLWGGQHLFLTAIVPEGRTFLRVQAALVQPVACLAVRTKSTLGAGNRPVSAEAMRVHFPGVLTEKYVRYEREETHAETETAYVLVTPKQIELEAGDLVTVQDGPAKAQYNVTAVHVLDPFKNEYEMVYRSDV